MVEAHDCVLVMRVALEDPYFLAFIFRLEVANLVEPGMGLFEGSSQFDFQNFRRRLFSRSPEAGSKHENEQELLHGSRKKVAQLAGCATESEDKFNPIFMAARGLNRGT